MSLRLHLSSSLSHLTRRPALATHARLLGSSSTTAHRTMATDAIVSNLFARAPPPLEPKAPYSTELKAQIARLDEHRYVVAALHLANDDIYACHDIVQAYEGDPTADLMHAVLHRREGDYWNSGYWFRRLGKHPLCPSPKEGKAFVDLCEKGETDALRARQWEELKTLVDWTRANCTT